MAFKYLSNVNLSRAISGNRDGQNISKRELWADYARGICILLVIIGHSSVPSLFTKAFIYSFHMPLFFFVSGYFFKDESDGMISFVKHKAISYLLPYFIYGVSYWTIKDIFMPLFLGTGIKFNHLLGVFLQIPNSAYSNGVWFFSALFVSNIIFKYIINLRLNIKFKSLFVLFFAFAAFGFNNLYHQRVPWYFDVSLIVLPYVLLGYLAKNNNYCIQKFNFFLYKKSNYGIIAYLILNVVLTIEHLRLTGRAVDYHIMRVDNLLTAYASGLFGILFIVELCRNISGFHILQFIGKNSIVYYLLDWTGRSIIYRIYRLFNINTGYLTLALDLLSSILFTIPIVIVIDKIKKRIKR